MVNGGNRDGDLEGAEAEMLEMKGSCASCIQLILKPEEVPRSNKIRIFCGVTYDAKTPHIYR
jgi:hypothetical protein